MYLSKLHINNFRCIKDLEINFRKGLNILIGENDTGKTAVLDALRWCFELGSENREFFISRDDFRIDKKSRIRINEIEFDLTFGDLSEDEQGIFIELLAIPEEESKEVPLEGRETELQLHVRFTYDEEKNRTRVNFWGGAKEGQTIPSEVLELIYCTYLDALRDAIRDLRPSKGNQLSQLFVKLRPDKIEQDRLASQINETVRSLDNWKSLLAEGKGKITEHLNNVTLKDTAQEVDIDFVQREFRKIAEGLRVRIPIKSAKNPKLEEASAIKKGPIEDFEIWQNGLGYNNLIYTATVLGNLREKKKVEPSSYTALLIEEPEAHLHPQLQNVFFRYLETMAGEQVQVFITSHSPTITAKTHIDSLIVLSKADEGISVLPLRKVDLKEKDKKYLQRFLDVTKSQLFFAKAVILVEGISEALLLPRFSDLLGKEEYNLEKNGIEVVNIGGVSFEPFAKLFNSNEKEESLGVRCAIITDDDIDPISNVAKTNRAENARSFDGGLLRVICAGYTFEYQLFLNNPKIMKDLYLELHPQTKFEGAKNEAYEFVKAVQNNKDKAVLAQILAEKIGKENLRFEVPAYIRKAIEWVVKGNGSGS
jgi:putative ATP-dependent endonuclease of OLD family